ncbi:MAG: sensor histidine kinase [Emticicia sp.]|uniref:sensor histidine kinase n=1 Tax=Emticicia sp. TaxID=1930953 RepID=UPI003BA69E33
MTKSYYQRINFKIIILHSICWILYIIYSTGNILILHPKEILVWDDMLVYYLGIAFLFYFLVNVTLKVLVEEKKIIYGLLLLLFNIFVFYLIEYSRLWLAEFMEDTEEIPHYHSNLKSFFVVYISELIQFVAAGLAWWYYSFSIKQSQEKLALEQRNHEIEVSFLKSQINQHFVYNMLNMFYSNAMKYSDTLAEGILSLSELMRFSVSHEQNSLIAVSEEIKYVESYIHLNQLRFEEKLLINFKTEGDLGAYKIPHLCILTLVENAFKHGNLKTEPLDITIIANTEELKVSLKNQKRSSKIEESTGIGLENLKRRLSLLLENRFSLETHQDQNFFYTELIIKP